MTISNKPNKTYTGLATATLALAISIANAAPPTAPHAVGAQVTSGRIQLHWSASTDSNGFITGYLVVRNGRTYSAGSSTSFVDVPENPGRYEYSIVAIDNEEERSIPSSTVTVILDANSSSTMVSVGSTTQSGSCVDTDGDGYGWDGEKTCDPTAINDSGSIENSNSSHNSSSTQCIDTDGDGYGWNGSATCDPGDPATAMIDTSTDQTADPLAGCDYTAADNNHGWGWNATIGESCPPL